MTIKFFSQFVDAALCRELELAENEIPATVADLVDWLLLEFGEPMRQVLLNPEGTDIQEDAFLLVNGLHLRALNGMTTALKGDDVVSVLQITEAG